MSLRTLKSALSSAAVLALGALALTACQPGTTGTASGASSVAASNPASSSPAPGGTGVAPVSAQSSAPSHGASGGTGTGGGDATSDSYAYKHPCSAGQLSVHVTRRAAAPSQRVISVRNTGSRSCGLSYFPLVYLDQSHAANAAGAVKPLVPGGLGGAPAYPVYAGRTAYAVIDLDPSGATSGTVAGIDELNVLADGDHMPNADTLNFPLGSGALVLKPKLGLYEATVADAVTSMQSADTPQS
ncbi:DUF4232 domain-containing protein [Streptacidiphilus jiangxiensis]|uniref:DUF4232 domain-containing protein n=1 Tax=Streptacidiphilus jiangxiensis TaxID=235985 RepID=A0A1H7M1Z9_STRJI|nr:DUF4232 domain-containing protein [Streptacidiphilus jiangxiensis]SEL05119.1 Protein of unknown function [Streptacidiphilus jiangxiensis]